MKCINKPFAVLIIIGAIILCGCSSAKYPMPYTADSDISSFSMVNSERNSSFADSFASKLCVVDSPVNASSIPLTPSAAAGLFDIAGKDVIFAKDIHKQLYPASLTKIMTAIVALKNGSLDMMLTASSNVKITESGAQVIGLNKGDTLTLEQALNLLLIYSANDVAVLIAEGISGSEEAFVELMNKEALSIGATNTHFTNAHGLNNENHYSTAYDMYLIMNEAIQFEKFDEIINSQEYSTTYYDAQGNPKDINIKSTNLYINGTIDAPVGVTVIGGKTGTTSVAGHCLIILSRDTKSNPFISVVMKSDNRDDLYSYMTSLLMQISN